MAQQTINIGSVANDGTGDPIRDAFDKVNDNFNEVYTSFTMTGAVTVGNSTVNSVVSNTGGLVTGNSTVTGTANSTTIKLLDATSNATLSTTTLNLGGTSTLNTIAYFIGNSSANTSSSVTVWQMANTISNTTLTPGSVFVGNASSNAIINSTHIAITSANVISNTGFTLGSSTSAANGASYLPNGLLMNWGWISANDSVGTVVFTTAYTTNAYVVTATSNATGTYAAAVVSQNSTAAEVRTGNVTSTNVRWLSIGA